MMRSRPNPDSGDDILDPAIQAELDQLDAALRGEPIADDVLAAIVRDVQATAPVMPDDLRKQLRHDVSEGFAKGGARGKLSAALGRTGRRAPSPGARRTSFAFGGGLAATVLVMVGVGFVVIGNAGSGGGLASTVSGTMSSESATPFSASPEATDDALADAVGTPSDSRAAVTPAAPPSDPASSVAEGVASSGLSAEQRDLVQKTLKAQPQTQRLSPSSGASSAASAKASTPATGQRRVEQAVDMTVRVKSGQLDEATDKVEDIVRLGNGYVADSRVSIRTRGAGTATFTLKLATAKLDQSLERLADLGTVTSQQQASRDITSSFDSAQSRLDDNKQVRAALLRALARAETDGQIASLKSRLADNRRTRESLESSLARLKTRTNLTTVELSLRAPSGDAPDTDDDGNWSLSDAAGDAVSALGAVTGVLLVVSAVLLPFGILAAIGWVLYRVRRKRSRESALGD